MKIEKSDLYLKNLFTILDYIIKQDSLSRAKNYEHELNTSIENLKIFPFKFRQSKWFKQENIRDLIFKGYTIPYAIEEDKIIILDIFKWQDR